MFKFQWINPACGHSIFFIHQINGLFWSSKEKVLAIFVTVKIKVIPVLTLSITQKKGGGGTTSSTFNLLALDSQFHAPVALTPKKLPDAHRIGECVEL